MQDREDIPDGAFADRPNRLPWPPIIYSCAFVMAWALQTSAPLGALDQALALIPKGVGLGAAVAGFILDLAAMSALIRHRTAILPNMGSSALVTGGVYAYTRNPIYLGNTILFLGFAIALRWGWLAIAAPLTIIAVTRRAIEREEKHLAARFEAEWRAYSARVRRWL
jgi:protein-S-isoprenylcysteine O-methyltransferase Ste14